MFADRYELGALLGVGGMAEVFEATVRGTHGFARRVAIKRLLREHAGDAALVRLFLDEARIASRLHHAGIVSVLDYAVADDVPFQVLELVDGKSAASLPRPLPLDIALVITLETAHALAYAHEAKDAAGVPLGIVHRDVKPSNILVSKSGDVKLGDFGIALARERASKTTGFAVRGTPAYMAPEQLMGTPVDARADIFSLGCTLHMLLTGESPATEENAQKALVDGTPFPISPKVPASIRAVIARAIAIDPAARWPTARALASVLGTELSPLLRTDAKSRLVGWLGAPGEAAPPKKEKPVESSIARTFLLAAFAVIVVGFGIGIGLWLGLRRPVRAADDARAPLASAPDASVAVDVAPPPEPSSAEPVVASGHRPGPSGEAPAGHCLCLGPSGMRQSLPESLCPPSKAGPPVCQCHGADGYLCFSSYVLEGHNPSELCPKSSQTMSATTVEGAPCKGFRQNLVQKPNAAGEVVGFIEATEPDVGEAWHCSRCRRETRGFGGAHGSPCTGIRSSDGARVNGRVDCN